MSTIIDAVNGLHEEIEGILKKYNVPLEERSYILERVGGAVGTISSIQKEIFDEKIGEIRKEIGAKQDDVRRDVEKIKTAAILRIAEANAKANDAYERGLAQASANPPKSGPGTFGVTLGLFFAALAFVVVASGLFKKSEKK